MPRLTRKEALKRCKPARAPIYRDGDHYALDPHDDEVQLLVVSPWPAPAARGAVDGSAFRAGSAAVT